MICQIFGGANRHENYDAKYRIIKLRS